MSSLDLENLEIYKIAIKISDNSWEIFQNLPKLFRFHLGDQFIRSADSIGANIAEGYGRFHYLDSLRFYYNSRGSLYEYKFWLETLSKRKLITEAEFDNILNLVTNESVKLNNFIKSIKRKNTKTYNS